MNNVENKMDGSTAYKVIDGDKMIVLQIFHGDRREEMLAYYRERYGSVSEDVDGDIVCFENEDE